MKKFECALVIIFLSLTAFSQSKQSAKKEMISRLDQLDLDLTKIDRAILDRAVDLKCDEDEEILTEQQANVLEINQLINKGKSIASEMQKLTQDYTQTAKTYKAQLEANKVLAKYGFGADSDLIAFTDKTTEISEDISELQSDLSKVPATDEVKKVGLQDTIMRKQCDMSDLAEEHNRVMLEKANNPLANMNHFIRQRPTLYNSTDALTWYCGIVAQRATPPANLIDESKTKCYKDDLAAKVQQAIDKMFPQKNKLDDSENRKASKPSDKSQTEAGFQLPGFNSADPNLGSGQNMYPQSVKPDELSKIFSPGNTQPSKNSDGSSSEKSDHQQSGR